MSEKINRKDRLLDCIFTSLLDLQNEVEDIYKYAEICDDDTTAVDVCQIESLEDRIKGIKGLVKEYAKEVEY
jgi:DNA repair ATPase RecN